MNINDEMIKRVFLFSAPCERAYYLSSNIPPLAIGILQGFLRSKGLSVTSWDLNGRLRKLSDTISRSEWILLYDKDAVSSYLGGAPDSSFDRKIEQLIDGICFEQADIIGISVGSNFSFFEIHFSLLLGKYVKARFGKPVVFGGDNLQYLWQFRSEFDFLWRQIIANFEYLFVGPGEKSFYRLIERLNGDSNASRYADLPGAVITRDDSIACNEFDEPTLFRPDFDGLTLDDYSVCIRNKEPIEKSRKLNEMNFFKWGFPHTLTASEVNRSRLKPEERKESLFIPYIFNYNCPFKCAFCVQSRKDKSTVASKAASEVVADIQFLSEKYATPYFYFFNNTFNYSKTFAQDFCRRVIDRGLEIYWSDCARFNNMDEKLVRLLYEAGCRKLVFGFETGSRKILDLIDKRLDLDHARNVLQWCHEAGIWAEVEVIVGLPYEFEEDFAETFSFIEEHITKKYITGFQLNKYFVVPVSLLGQHPEKYGIRLVKVKNRIEKLLERSKDNFLTTTNATREKISASNFQLYRYKEQDGRSVEQIIKETESKAKRLHALYAKLEVSEEIKLFNLLKK
jgi:radical SAM superfamily enzyme YgiQ (UPF0313 family)